MTSYHVLILEWWLPWDCGLWWQNVALEMEVKLFTTWRLYITLCCFSISRGEMQKEEDEETGGDYGGHGGAVPSWQYHLHAQRTEHSTACTGAATSVKSTWGLCSRKKLTMVTIWWTWWRSPLLATHAQYSTSWCSHLCKKFGVTIPSTKHDIFYEQSLISEV